MNPPEMHEVGPYPNLLHGLHGLLLDQFDVERRGQDEDEHGSSGGTYRKKDVGHFWRRPSRAVVTPVVRALTDEAEDVPDGGDEDDQGVGACQQDHGDDNVADPAEVLGGAQEVVD